MISNQCIVLQTALIDGSPCGYGGHCYNQTCQSGSWEDTFDAMYTQNLQISIPVTVVVGILVSHQHMSILLEQSLTARYSASSSCLVAVS